jgi:hypothetical protein
MIDIIRDFSFSKHFILGIPGEEDEWLTSNLRENGEDQSDLILS